MRRDLCFMLAFSVLAIAFSLVCPSSTRAQSGPPAYRDSRLPVEQRVADLMGRMTLEGRARTRRGQFTPEGRGGDSQILDAANLNRGL